MTEGRPGRVLLQPFGQGNLSALSLVLLTLAVFAPALANGFIAAYDDELYLTLNTAVRQGLTPAGFRWAFTTLRGGNWHPVTWLSHMLDVTLFGLVPAGHHLVSVLVHAAAVLLLYRLLLRFGLGIRPAWVAALLFALHPQRVESVAWAAERKDVLSLFFGLGALTAYLSYLDRRTLRRYLAMAGLYALSLMSKPMLVTLPLLMLALDHFLFRRLHGEDRWSVLMEKIPLLLPAVAVGVVTWYAQAGSNAIVASHPGDRFVVALAAYGEYLRLFFAPVGLSFHYPLDSTIIGILKPVTGFATITAGVWLMVRPPAPLVSFGCCWFLLTLLPVSGIVRFGGQFIADRYTYFPHIGLLILLAWGGERLLDRRPELGRMAAGGVLLVMAGVMVLTVRQIGFWHDGERLYRRAIQLNPANWLAYSNLGAALLQQDRYGEGFLLLARGQLLRGRPKEALVTLSSARREGGVPQRELDMLQEEIVGKMR